jgi:hypothetical protein
MHEDYINSLHLFSSIRGTCTQEGVTGLHTFPPPNWNSKITDFVDMIISNILHDLSFSWNEPLKLADDQYIIILKNKIENLRCFIWNLKKTTKLGLVIYSYIRCVSHGMCSYICTYINALANSVMLQLYL